MRSKINRSVLVENLRELADRSLQEELWIHGDHDRMSSFTEAISGVFDDSGLSRALEAGNAWHELPAGAWRVAKALDKAVGAVPEDETPDVVVAHPTMEAVRKLAAELLTQLEEV